VAKGVGAVAGGIAGIGSAFKKGFSAGKSTVAGKPDPNAAKSATPATGGSTPAASNTGQNAAPDQTQANLAKTGNPVGAPNDQTPAASTAPTDTKTAAPATAAKPADATAAPAADPKADTAYAQAQKAIAGLAPEQKKEVVTMIQADPKVKASLAKPAAQKPAAASTAPQTVAKPKIKQPLKIKGAKQAAPQPQQQLAASKENLGNMVAEGFSIFRKH
jgi:hypothetical protein